MQTTRYLIVGGGMTGDAACKGIRERRRRRPHRGRRRRAAPALRAPAALEGALEGHGGEHDLARHRGARRRAAARPADRRARPRRAHRATDDQGETYALREAAARDRRAARGGSPSAATTSSTSARSTTTGACGRSPTPAPRFVVIGGGFIGSEIAAALAINGCPVTMVFPEPGIGARIFPPDLSAFVDRLLPRARTCEVLAGASVTGIERVGDTVHVTTGDGRVLEADAVVAGLGIEPSVELAAGAGLPVVERDRRRRPSAASAAATTSSPPATSPASPSRRSAATMRVEHEDHAKSHGRQVGANMAGAGRALRPPAVLLLRPLRPRLRGRRRARQPTAHDSLTGPTSAARAPSTTSTTRAGRGASCSGTSSGASTLPAT